MLPCHTRIHFKEKTKPNVRCLYCLDWRSLLKCFTTTKKAMKIQASLSPKECACKQTCHSPNCSVKYRYNFSMQKLLPVYAWWFSNGSHQGSAFAAGTGRRCTNHFAFFCSKKTGGKWGWCFIHVFCCQQKTYFIGKKHGFLVVWGEDVQVFECCLTSWSRFHFNSVVSEIMAEMREVYWLKIRCLLFLLHVDNMYPCINYTLSVATMARPYISHPNSPCIFASQAMFRIIGETP